MIDPNSTILTRLGAIPLYTFHQNIDNNTYYYYIGLTGTCSRNMVVKVDLPDKNKEYFKWMVYTESNPEGVLVHNMICTGVLWAYPEKGMNAIRVNEITGELYRDPIIDVKTERVSGVSLSNLRSISGLHIGTVINGFPVRDPSGYASEYKKYRKRRGTHEMSE